MGQDCVFRMGATHSVCQDYALAGLMGGWSYVVLSDGCSGIPVEGDPGAPYTDWGARFLARSALRALQCGATDPLPLYEIVCGAWAMCRAAKLKPTALDATLLVALEGAAGVTVHWYGDGVVLARHRDGGLWWSTRAFGQNMPLYPSYLLDPGRLRQYRADSGEAVQTVTDRGEAVRSAFAPDFLPSLTFPRCEYDLVLVASDGAESFQDERGAPVPTAAVLEELVSIKGFAGEFVSRRCKRFLGHTCPERGWKHLDDLAVGGIHLGEWP